MNPPEQQSNDCLPSELQIIIVTIIVICLCFICFSFVLLKTKATFSNAPIAFLVALASWTLVDHFEDFLIPRGDFWITVPAAICLGLLNFVQVRGKKMSSVLLAGVPSLQSPSQLFLGDPSTS